MIDWEDIGKTFFMIVLVTCTIIGLWCMVHFASKEKDNVIKASSDSRFETIETRMITARISYTIVYDKQTKVIYSIDSTGECTPLIDENGDPLIYKDE